jgi:hypothetical protein
MAQVLTERLITPDNNGQERKAVMPTEALTDFVKLLANLQPAWVLVIAVSCILAYRSPELVKEFRRRLKR